MIVALGFVVRAIAGVKAIELPGEEIPITARRVVTFRPGQKLKSRVEAYAGTER